jgi:hypothetical protein
MLLRPCFFPACFYFPSINSEINFPLYNSYSYSYFFIGAFIQIAMEREDGNIGTGICINAEIMPPNCAEQQHLLDQQEGHEDGRGTKEGDGKVAKYLSRGQIPLPHGITGFMWAVGLFGLL